MTSTSWYRRNVWTMKGTREYTKAGYEAASLRFEEKDLEVDCSDRHFMITGANSGLGLTTALEIAKKGGILHLVCRNAKSMKEARSHIITETGNDRIYQHQVNLSKPAEVAKWAKEFTETHGRLDVVIHNAGSLNNEREVDEDNIETMFAVHVLAVHLITLILLPVLRRSNDPRVIIVSSAGMLKVRLDASDLNFEKMHPFIGRLAYSQTKRQQVVMNFAYAQRYDKVKFYSMHPGWADTPGVRKSLPEFYEQMKDKLRTPLQGADTIIWLAVSQAALKHSSGLFFQDRVPTTTHLPLAWTRTSNNEEQQFMTSLDKLFVQYSSLDTSPTPKSSSGHPDRIEMNGEQESILHHPSTSEHESTSHANTNHEVEEKIKTTNSVDENKDFKFVQYNKKPSSSDEHNHIPEKIFDEHSDQRSFEAESEFTESSQLEKDCNDLLNEKHDSHLLTNNDSNTESAVSFPRELDHPLNSEDSLPIAANVLSQLDIDSDSRDTHAYNSLNESEKCNADSAVPKNSEIEVTVAEEALNLNDTNAQGLRSEEDLLQQVKKDFILLKK